MEPGKKGFDKSKILAFHDAHIRSGIQNLRLVVDGAPALAGTDPYSEWIDRNSDDNVTGASDAGSS